MTWSANYGTREREEVRGLIIISECAGPPDDQRSWFWGRVRLYLIVAHHGWAAAIGDSKNGNM